ncbi:MAG: TetR family transcriptional regulator [Myxococcales bacterium]
MGDSKAKSRKDAKRETREALIRAGMQLFSEEGVDLPSLDAICATAGFTRGAFYVHFKDRDDFLEAVVERVMTDFVRSVLAAGGEGDDLVSIIERFMVAAEEGSLPLVGERKIVSQLLARGAHRAETMQERFKGLLEMALRHLATAAEDAQRDGTLKTPVEPDLVAAWLVAAALGLGQLLDVGLEFDFARVRRSARQLLQIEEG